MKTTIAILAALLFPGVASAGQNAYATIIPGAGPWTTSTTCYSLRHTFCSEIAPDYPTSGGAICYLAIYVATDHAPLSVAGLDLGVSYGAGLSPLNWVSCGALQLPTDTWPQSGSGNTIVWTEAQSGQVVLAGYFKILVIGGHPHADYLFTLGAHPTYGGPRVWDQWSEFDQLYCCGSDLCCDYCEADYYGGGPVGIQSSTWGHVKALYGN